MATTYLIDIDRPAGQRGTRCHVIYSGLDEARAWVRSQLALGPDIPFKFKTTYSIRPEGSLAGDWIERMVG